MTPESKALELFTKGWKPLQIIDRLWEETTLSWSEICDIVEKAEIIHKEKSIPLENK